MKNVRTDVSTAVVLCLVAGVTACSESRTFTPVDPSDISARAIQALDQASFIATQAVGAGRTAKLSGAIFIYPETVNPSFVHVLDWLSPDNRVIFTVHRQGDPPAPAPDGSFITSNNCSVPETTGSIIGAPLSRPLCPIVLSNTSSDKPKILTIPANLPPGNYVVVASNYGSTNETIRWAFSRN